MTVGRLNVMSPLDPLGTYLYITIVFPALGCPTKNRPIQSCEEWVFGAVQATVTAPPETGVAGEAITVNPFVEMLCARLCTGE